MTSTVLVLNAGSGGGRAQPMIRAEAQRRGIAVREVGPGADPAALAGSADADVLAVAGGDGTVGAVAAVAVDRDVPLLVLPCGTRNHFASDAGLDTSAPAAGFAALDAGEEFRVDVGSVDGRLFLNTVSVGFYSSMVQDPQYRRHRIGVSTRYVRRAITGGGASLRMSTVVDPRLVLPERALTILVSVNAYSPGLAPGAALRPRMDEGVLWFHVLGVDGHRGPVAWRVLRTVAGILVGRTEVAAWAASSHTLIADRARVMVGIDSEAVELDAPLKFRALPGALRLLGPARSRSRETSIELIL